jgi:hypothetical protein
MPADFLADSVNDFLTTDTSSSKTDIIHLGLTFSFPVEQTSLASGKILTWTKGFSAKNAIGHDAVELLQDAFDRKKMRVKCVALVNDVRCVRVVMNKPILKLWFLRQSAPSSLALTAGAVVSWAQSSGRGRTVHTWRKSPTLLNLEKI